MGELEAMVVMSNKGLWHPCKCKNVKNPLQLRALFFEVDLISQSTYHDIPKVKIYIFPKMCYRIQTFKKTTITKEKLRGTMK